MSSTLEKLLRDAQQLVGKMKQNDIIAEGLTEQYRLLGNKIEGMKKFQEVSLMNENEKSSNQQHLNLSLLPDNQHLLDLENENRELKNFLDEHQTALGLIMSRYRHLINQQLSSHAMALQTDDYFSKFELLEDRINQITDMRNVIWKVLELDKSSPASDQLVQLQKEHSTLCQLLHISKSFGNNCLFNNDSFKSDNDELSSSTCFENDQIVSFICPNSSQE